MNMETTSLKTLLNHSGKFGLYGGLLLCAFTAIIYVLSINMFDPIMGLLSMAVTYGLLIFFMYKSAASYRTAIDVPRLEYWHAFFVLFASSIISLYVSAIFSFILNTVIDPQYHIELYKQAEEAYIEVLPEEMVAETMQKIQDGLNPTKQFINSLIGTPIMGGILSLIMAFFVRNNPKYKEKI
jgi:phosphate/sulfate permease